MTEAIVIENLKKYFGKIHAVDGISFSIPKGAVCGLLGPNGAGKTTTFRMLCGYLNPTEGQIRIFDHKPRSKELLHGRVLALPQDAILPSNNSISRFLQYLAELQHENKETRINETNRVLKLVALDNAANQNGNTMSHGMTRRVALASALLGNPELIMLDEPTGGLDPQNAHEVKEIVKNLKGKSTVIISSHNLAEIQEICTHVAIIDHGKLVTFGTVEEVCNKGNHLVFKVEQDNVDLSKLQNEYPNIELKFDICTKQLEVKLNENSPEFEKMVTKTILNNLLEQNIDIIGFHHGESLEKRFLELT